MFLAFAWAELVWEHGDTPANVATAVLAYCAIAWAGMFVFGREIWLKRGETFAVVFGLLSRFSPTEIRVLDPKVCEACPVRNCRSASGCVDCYACFRRAPAVTELPRLLRRAREVLSQIFGRDPDRPPDAAGP